MLEYAIGAATVGIAWSEYLNKLLADVRQLHDPVRVVPLAVRVAIDARGVLAHGIMNVPGAVHRRSC